MSQPATNKKRSRTDSRKGLARATGSAVWERGYRCHGLWIGNKRIARVSLGPRKFWRSGRDPYLWETDLHEGQEMTLKLAKLAAMCFLPNKEVSNSDPEKTS